MESSRVQQAKEVVSKSRVQQANTLYFYVLADRAKGIDINLQALVHYMDTKAGKKISVAITEKIFQQAKVSERINCSRQEPEKVTEDSYSEVGLL